MRQSSARKRVLLIQRAGMKFSARPRRGVSALVGLRVFVAIVALRRVVIGTALSLR